MYNLSQELIDLNNLLEENGGEITPEIEQQLEITQTDLQIKAVDYCYLAKELDGDVSAIDAEIERLQALKTGRANLAKRLKTTVTTAMLMFGFDKIETPTMKLGLRKSTAIEITDESLLTENYFVTRKEVSKTAIKMAIEQGVDVQGARQKTNHSLIIK